MKLLLDTHMLIWWLGDSREVSKRMRNLIGDSTTQVYVSSVSAFEITTKFRLGKLPSAALFVNAIADTVESAGFNELPLTTAHATRAGLLPNPHRDPFDRLLAAQALVENLPIASVDTVFDSFMVERLN